MTGREEGGEGMPSASASVVLLLLARLRPGPIAARKHYAEHCTVMDKSTPYSRSLSQYIIAATCLKAMFVYTPSHMIAGDVHFFFSNT